MPTFNTIELITELQNETESILQKAITQWQMMPTQILLFKQDENCWSAVQCMMHLNSYGYYYLPAIQKSIEEADTRKLTATAIFESSLIGNWFTGLIKPKGKKQVIRKMKSPKEHIPIANENSDKVLAEFIDQQETLLTLLERAKSIDLRKAKTPVSISRFIKLPLGDTFRFLTAHNERHLLQAERAMQAAEESVITA